MIVHIFNTGVISGPEKLVLPSLPKLPYDSVVIFLIESRLGEKGRAASSYAKSLGLKVCEIEVRSRIDFRAINSLCNTLKVLKPQIAHAHDVKASSYLLFAAKKLKDNQMRLISTHHGVTGRRGLKLRLYERFYSSFILPSFDRVLAVSPTDKVILAKRGLRNVIVHRNGIDGNFVSHKQRKILSKKIRESWGLRKLGISDTALCLGVVGRIAPEKRVDRVLSVAKHLLEWEAKHDKLPEWHILIFGSGPLEYKLQKLSYQLGLSKRIHWMGYNERISDQMAGLDLLISLSDAEGIPISMLEAGFAGTPLFATDIDSNITLVPSTNVGTLVDPLSSDASIAKRLALVLQSSLLRKRQASEFQLRCATHFSGFRWREELMCIYEAEALKPLKGEWQRVTRAEASR